MLCPSSVYTETRPVINHHRNAISSRPQNVCLPSFWHDSAHTTILLSGTGTAIRFYACAPWVTERAGDVIGFVRLLYSVSVSSCSPFRCSRTPSGKIRLSREMSGHVTSTAHSPLPLTQGVGEIGNPLHSHSTMDPHMMVKTLSGQARPCKAL